MSLTAGQLAGPAVALMLGSGAVIQIVGRQLESLRAQTLGLVAMIAGVAALIVADTDSSLFALFIATVLAGSGQGLAFMGSLGESVRSHRRHAKATLSPVTTWSYISAPRCP